MSRYSSDAKQRRSKKYQAVLADLRASQASIPPDTDTGTKRDRHLADSQAFRAGQK